MSPFWTEVGIKAFRALRAIKKGLEFLWKIFLTPLRPVGRLVIKLIVIPIYRLVVLTKLRIQRLALPARGLLLFLITNRYLFHMTVGTAALATIFANVQTRNALALDAGQHSVLYALMTNGESEIVQEDFKDTDLTAGTSRRLAGTVEAVPHLDFDYGEIDTADQSLSLTIPGTVVLRPVGEQQATETRPVRTGVETYVVKEGDTLGTIARDFDVDVGTVLWANNLSARDFIRPGDTLKILPVSGVLATVRKGDTLSKLAERYGGDLDAVMRTNQLTSEIVPVGKELIIPDGEPPAMEVNALIANARQREIKPASVSRDRLQEGGATRQVSADKGAASNVAKPADAAETKDKPKARLLWPTSGHVITQYYGWRHVGLDIDGDFTSPLYASEEGTVVQAGWNSGGYGLQVLIEHPNGMKTRYAHASKLFVKAGDTVHRGQTIAMMGSTGRSTGSHIHYEVYVNGKRVNPLLYIR